MYKLHTGCLLVSCRLYLCHTPDVLQSIQDICSVGIPELMDTDDKNGSSTTYPTLNKYSTIDLILSYTDVCKALYTQCFPSGCGKNFTGDSGGIQTHNLLLTSADVLTFRPPSLPDDNWPARILYSSGFRDIYRLKKLLRRVINNWFNFALTPMCV